MQQVDDEGDAFTGCEHVTEAEHNVAARSGRLAKG
jgi:hypothetical protein